MHPMPHFDIKIKPGEVRPQEADCWNAWIKRSSNLAWNLDMISKCFFILVPMTILTHVLRSVLSSSVQMKPACTVM